MVTVNQQAIQNAVSGKRTAQDATILSATALVPPPAGPALAAAYIAYTFVDFSSPKDPLMGPYLEARGNETGRNSLIDMPIWGSELTGFEVTPDLGVWGQFPSIKSPAWQAMALIKYKAADEFLGIVDTVPISAFLGSVLMRDQLRAQAVSNRDMWKHLLDKAGIWVDEPVRKPAVGRARILGTVAKPPAVAKVRIEGFHSNIVPVAQAIGLGGAAFLVTHWALGKILK